MAKRDVRLAYDMMRENKSVRETAKACGVSRKTIQTWKKKIKSWNDVLVIEQYLKKIEESEANPCAICQTNIAICPWLHEHKSVPGWDAKLVSRKEYQGRRPYFYVTWQISDCPLYQAPKGERRCEED